MIEFPDLPEAIDRLGPEGRALLQLAKTPSSQALVGIVSERLQFTVKEDHPADDFDLYVCEDCSNYDVRLPSPFAVLCLAPPKIPDPQAFFGQVRDQLRTFDLHARPTIIFHPGDLGELRSLLELSETTFVPFSSDELARLLIAHPPRNVLMRRVVARVPVKRLNPYIYRGPVDKHLFVGRQQQLDRLCELSVSYALIGPRATGKTSLINRACERMRDDGQSVIRLELGATMHDRDLAERFLYEVISHYGLRPSALGRVTIGRLERHILRLARHSPRKRVAVFTDEADALAERCPGICAMLRSLHNQGYARIVLVGYKQLRKAICDVRQQSLMNVYQELPLSRLTLHECGELVLGPMTSLGVRIADPSSVVQALYRDSGGGPSRIQLLCHALVDQLETKTERTITREEAEQAIRLPDVQHVLKDWFSQSTSLMEKYIATMAAIVLPCDEREFVSKLHTHSPEIGTDAIESEIEDLISADILERLKDGRMNFSFPAVRDLAVPGEARSQLAELRKAVVHGLRH